MWPEKLSIIYRRPCGCTGRTYTAEIVFSPACSQDALDLQRGGREGGREGWRVEERVGKEVGKGGLEGERGREKRGEGGLE